MYTALQQEKADDICHLWHIACSVHIHVTLVEKGNDVVSQQYLLQRSLECSCEKDLLAEDSFVTWSNKLLRYLGLVTKTSKNRSLKADLEALHSSPAAGFRYNTQPLTRAMLHAAQTVSAVIIGDAQDALQSLSREFGGDFLERQYSKVNLLVSAFKRWASDGMSSSRVAVFVFQLMHLELQSGKRSVLFFRRTALEATACSNCETSGVACGRCSPTWIRLALEKCRMHFWLLRSLQDKISSDAQLVKLHAFAELAKPFAKDGLSETFTQLFAPWLRVLNGAVDDDLKKNLGSTIRETVLEQLASGLVLQQNETPGASESSKDSLLDERQVLLVKAQAHLNKFVHLACRGRSSDQKDLDSMWNSPSIPDQYRNPGVLNSSHRLFILCAELYLEKPKDPWSFASESSWTVSQMREFKNVLKWLHAEASGPGDLCLITDANCGRVRRLIEDECRALSAPSHVGGVSAFWSAPPRPGRHVFANNFAESWRAFLWCKSPRVRIAGVRRKESVVAWLAHAGSLACGVAFLEFRKLQFLNFGASDRLTCAMKR